MSANILIKITVAVLILGAGMLVVTKFSRSGVASSLPVPTGGEPLDAATRTALGIEGDTPDDVVSTFIQTMRAQNRKLDTFAADNEALRADNVQLSQMEQTLAQKMAHQIERISRDLRSDNRTAQEQSKRAMDRALVQLQAQGQGDPRESGNGLSPRSHNNAPLPVDTSGTVWFQPLGASGDFGAPGVSAKSPLARLPASLVANAASVAPGGALGSLRSQTAANQAVRPAFTIAKNATLIGATAFTSLIGRVPVGGNVADPYSFKILVGPDNLVANGQEIPEFAYAVMSGKAIGDWTLSCVAGDVYSMTFVFDDGRIVTLPQPKDIREGSSTTPDLKLGELSDARGNPCVIGRKISNAARYLAQRIGASAAGAAARAAAAAQTTTTRDQLGLGGATTIVTGDTQRFVMDETLAGAAQETAQWIRDRQALEFDAVYVPAGAPVAIHVTEELRIDYDPAGRLTHHNGYRPGGTYRALD